MTKVRYQDPLFQALNASGASVPNAKIYFYVAGTTTLSDTYQDESLTLKNTNPVIAGGDGRFPPIYLQSKTYTVKMTDADDVVLDTQDYDATEPAVIGAATAATSGTVELATPAEADTGTDTSRAVTPEGLEESRKRLRASREETGTSFTLLATDAGQHIFANNAGAITVTVNSAVNAANDVILITQYGAGQVTISPGTAVLRSANGLKTQAQYSTIQLFFKSDSEVIVTGDTVV